MMSAITIGTNKTRTIPMRSKSENKPIVSPLSYSGPDIPSRRMRQKCTAINRLATKGKKMQCRI